MVERGIFIQSLIHLHSKFWIVKWRTWDFKVWCGEQKQHLLSYFFLFKLYNLNLFYLYNNTVVLVLYVPYEIKWFTLTRYTWLNLQNWSLSFALFFSGCRRKIKEKKGTSTLTKTEGNFARVKLNFYFNLQVDVNDNNV